MSRGCNRNRERSFSSPAHPVGLKLHGTGGEAAKADSRGAGAARRARQTRRARAYGEHSEPDERLVRSLLVLVVNAISTNRLVKGFRVDELRTNIRASSPVAFIR